VYALACFLSKLLASIDWPGGVDCEIGPFDPIVNSISQVICKNASESGANDKQD
jgi:hypothetical protein